MTTIAMTTIKKLALCAVAAALTGGLASQASAASLQEIKDRGTVRIAVANEIPYGYMDLSGEAKGVGPETAQHIMEQLGIKEIEWVTTNFGSLIPGRSEEHTSELQSLMRISYAVFCLKKKTQQLNNNLQK